jgi:hypothetical protein
MSDADSANPSDEIAVFQTYIDLINSERKTIRAATMRCSWPIRSSFSQA